MNPPAPHLDTTGRRHPQGGLSLVELMVATVLALLIVGAVVGTYLSGKRNFRISEGVDRVQENARAVLPMLDAVIRNAGYRADPRVQTDPATYFTPLPQFAVYGASAQSPRGLYPFAASALATSDYLAVSYLGNDDGSIGTCLAAGNSSGGPAVRTGQIATNVFYLGKSAGDAVSSLYCATLVADALPPHGNPRSDAQPLLFGITGLTVRYGVDDDGDGVIDRYLGAGDITAALAWRRVLSIQLDITSESPDIVAAGESVAGRLDKGRLQRSLRQTVALRNPLLR